MNRRTLVHHALALTASLCLGACGGGGSDAAEPAPAVGTLPTAPTAPTAPTPAASRWTMDGYTYFSGGYSGHSTAQIAGRPLTAAVVSTATLAGGDKANGAFSGSGLNFSFFGTASGTYTVAKDRATLLAGAPDSRLIYVESNVGIAVNTGATVYTAASGEVTVTQDSAGKFHFTSVGTLPTVKTLDVQGGVAGAPASMGLTVHDAY